MSSYLATKVRRFEETTIGAVIAVYAGKHGRTDAADARGDPSMNKSARTLMLILLFAAVISVSNASAKPHDENPKRNDRHAGKVDKDGWKVDKDGRKTVPVPEPATMLLMGVGLGATMIGRAAKRRFGRRDDKQ